MTNFGEETVNILAQYEYTIDDIDWIGNYAFKIPIHEFFDVARNTIYDEGYGSAEMPIDLIIVMKDGSWFSRGEYDGSEWWKINRVPHKPKLTNHLKFKSFCDPSYNWKPTLVEACMHQDFKAV